MPKNSQDFQKFIKQEPQNANLTHSISETWGTFGAQIYSVVSSDPLWSLEHWVP